MAEPAPVGGPDPAKPAGDAGAASRTGMAAERTWLAWWRTALAASAGALAVGRVAPEVLHVASAPYIVLGCAYAALSICLLIVGARRQRDLQRATERGENAPLPFAMVAAFTVGGVALALMTVVLVLAQS
jgi:putative membrane protein